MALIHWVPVMIKAKESPVIPRICPNCLQPGDVECRYGFRKLLGRTTHYQSFYYCGACANSVQAYLAWRNRIGRAFGAVLGLGTACGIYILLNRQVGLEGPLDGLGSVIVQRGVISLLAITAFFVMYGLSLWLFRRIGMSRCPLRPEQAVWGPAAYYLGPPPGPADGTSEFRAVRPEWIRELVQSNSSGVDDATHIRWIRTPKPPPPSDRPNLGGS